MTEVEAKFVSAIKSISSKRAAPHAAAGAVFDGLPSNLEKTKKSRGGAFPDLGAALLSTYYICLLKINTSARVPLPVDEMTLMGSLPAPLIVSRRSSQTRGSIWSRRVPEPSTGLPESLLWLSKSEHSRVRRTGGGRLYLGVKESWTRFQNSLPLRTGGSARKRKLQPHIERPASVRSDFPPGPILTVTASDSPRPPGEGRRPPRPANRVMRAWPSSSKPGAVSNLTPFPLVIQNRTPLTWRS